MSTTAARIATIGVALVTLTGCASSSGHGPAQGSTDSRTTGEQPASSGTSAAAQPATGTSSASSSSSGPAAAAPASSRSSSSTAASTSRCTTGHLRVSLATTEGAAGSLYDTVRLTNTGATTCSLHGYPGVSLVGHGNGTQVGAAAERDRSARPTTVTVRPGASATFVVRRTQALNYPRATCSPTPADGYRVYPPDQAAALYLPLRGATGCASRSLHLLTVRPVGATTG